MIRFAVYPGYVISTWDWDEHYVTSTQLMNLYRVHPRECVVIEEGRFQGYRQEEIDLLLRLEPRVTGYRPVSARERAMYPLSPKQIEEVV